MSISKEQHWRSPAKKLEEGRTTRLQGWQKMGLREQENVVFFFILIWTYRTGGPKMFILR